MPRYLRAVSYREFTRLIHGILVKEEYLYLLVPTSQSETHSKAQEISLASKMKILDYIDMYFIYFLPMNENRVLPYRVKRPSCPAEECGLSI